MSNNKNYSCVIRCSEKNKKNLEVDVKDNMRKHKPHFKGGNISNNQAFEEILRVYWKVWGFKYD